MFYAGLVIYNIYIYLLAFSIVFYVGLIRCNIYNDYPLELCFILL